MMSPTLDEEGLERDGTTMAVETAVAPPDAPTASPRRIREPRSDKILHAIMLTLLCLFTLTIVYPFVYIVSASFSDPTAVISGEMWLWPVGFSLDAYQAVLDYPAITRGFFNSLLYSGAAMLVGTAVTLMGGYALSRRDLVGNGPITMIFVLTMMFSGGMIPTYLVVKDLGMLNTIWAMILPGAVSVWQLIVTRTFFQVTIPHELLECSRLDGANDLRFFAQVVIPLSKPIIAVNLLLYGVATWNAYFNGLIYLTDESLYPLQLVMRNILLENTFDPSKMANADPTRIAAMQQLADKLKYALIIIASVPPLIAYPFVQKHFVKGMMIGSLKG
ncbi:carbohydrate ABC transporter permease [Brachybacterium sp. J144]|uniref:carbohydrate ABC transporter permease n=1 Tax=Brachybacterium sp. J144 TaxID=3116487 RepID=UPI002E75D871|nr:carbohydrate ABC transporter permease [Brachybacterium sp. J144]MEE1649447.1 carbohydrate ABC transporter permease [Brachybacterium sp. J144]